MALTQKQIRTKRDKLVKKQLDLYLQFEEIKELCTHPDVTKQYKGSTGNYDPSCDSYWINWQCMDCGKKWVTDQSRENLLKPGREIK